MKSRYITMSRHLGLAMSWGFAVASQAQVILEAPRVRATVANQQATGETLYVHAPVRISEPAN